MSKAASRRMTAAFAKIEMCALVELGIHNPLAATVGLKGEGEWTLAKELLGSLPKRRSADCRPALRLREVSRRTREIMPGRHIVNCW